MVWLAVSRRASKSRRNSLKVNVISPAGGRGVAFDRGSHGQERMREHGQGGRAVPGFPAPDLVLIEPDQSFGGLEGFLDTPALAGHLHEGAQRDRAGVVAAQVSVLAGAVVAVIPLRRSVSARHASGLVSAARRHGSGRHGWGRAG